MPFPSRCPLRQLVLALSLGAVVGLTFARDLPAAEEALEAPSVEASSVETPPAPIPASSAPTPAPGEPAAPGEWQAWNGLHFRLDETGDVQCYSEDGDRCSLNTPTPSLARPVRCERQRHPLRSAIPGAPDISGYEELDHWCNNAYANLFAKWTNYQPLGYPVVLSTNARGDVMCKSLDATTCLAPGEHGPLAPKQLKPVVCGKLLERLAGITGYDDPDHWCSSPELVTRIKAPKGESAQLSKDRKLLEQRYQVPVPSWVASDQPTWIVRFVMPHPERSGIHLKAVGRVLRWIPERPHFLHYSWPRNGVERIAGIQLNGDQRHILLRDFETLGSARVPVLDKKGRGMLAVRIDDPPGRVRFFQSDGWRPEGLARLGLDGEGTLLNLQERILWPESPTMTLDITTSLWPAKGQQRLDVKDLRRAPLPVLHDILVTRKRRPPGKR